MFYCPSSLFLSLANHQNWFMCDFVKKMVDFLIGHYTYRMFPPAIDIIPTSLAVAYSNGKYTNQNWRVTTWHPLQSLVSIPVSDGQPWKSRNFSSSPEGGGGERWVVGHCLSVRPCTRPPGEGPEVRCRLPCPSGNGRRKHWKISIRSIHIAQTRECSDNRPWRQPPLWHREL